MELALNLVWCLLTLAGIACYLRLGSADGSSRRMQVVALGVLALILFPVISVTDELSALQNPAEVDTCIRRNNAAVQPHTVVPDIASGPAQDFTAFLLVVLGNAPAHDAEPRLIEQARSFYLFSRPPPAA